MEAAGSEFLEVAGLVGLDERLVRLAAVEGIGLQPFFAAADTIGARRGRDLVEARIQIGDNRLTGQGRQSLTVRLVFRTDRDHADEIAVGAVAARGNRARIK